MVIFALDQPISRDVNFMYIFFSHSCLSLSLLLHSVNVNFSDTHVKHTMEAFCVLCQPALISSICVVCCPW